MISWHAVGQVRRVLAEDLMRTVWVNWVSSLWENLELKFRFSVLGQEFAHIYF